MSLPLPPPVQLPLPGAAPLPLPPKPQATHTPAWELEKLGYNKLRLKFDGTLTRGECFRLIGELERIGASL